MRPRERRALLALALLFTGLNSFKPLTLDDTVYWHYARHIASHPLDPYGFRLAGAQSANAVLAPPALLYWWAAALRLGGDHPFLWKLALLPFALAFTFSLAALGRRFAPRLELPLTFLVVLSPALLPCLNLMLDVPALALGLTAVVVFLRACDRGAAGGALAAGLLAGVAAQTKYTAFVVPAVFVLHGLLGRRLRLGLLAAAPAVLVFVGWESLTAAAYGHSHFVLALREREAPVVQKLRLVWPLVGTLGVVAPAVALLGLAAFGASRRALACAAAAVAAGFLLVAFVPGRAAVLVPGPLPGRPLLSVSAAAFGTLGLSVVAAAALTSWRLLSRAAPDTWRAEVFLVGWLGLELAGYFALSPYPAVRRVLGLVVVAALLVGRLAARDGRRAPAWAAAGVSAALGLLAYAVEFRQQQAEQVLAAQVVRHARRFAPRAEVYFFGFGAFTFYGERLGMTRLGPAGRPPRPGDCLVLFGDQLQEGSLRSLTRLLVPAGELSRGTPFPFRSGYQAGGTPLEHHEGPLVRAALFRWPD
jgi:hypothetical protein